MKPGLLKAFVLFLNNCKNVFIVCRMATSASHLHTTGTQVYGLMRVYFVVHWHVTTLCNVPTAISVQSWIQFWLRSCIDDGRVKPLRKVSSGTSPRPKVKVRSQEYGGQFMWKWFLMLSVQLFHNPTPMNLEIVLMKYVLLHERKIRKIHGWDNQFIQSSVHVIRWVNFIATLHC